MAEENKHPPTPEEKPQPETPPNPEKAAAPITKEKQAPTGKVIGLSSVRSEPEKSGPPMKDAPEAAEPASVTEYTKQEWTRPAAPAADAPKRGRQPKKEQEQSGKKPNKVQTADKPRKGRPPKADKTAPDKASPPKAKEAAKDSKPAPVKEQASTPEATPKAPPEPIDATRAEKEEVVYLDLAELHPFKDHPFGVRDDDEMKALVESVRKSGINQPALVRPREDGGYEIVAGHRRQMASQLAGYKNMPCIVRSMTDDEAILAMTDDNLRHREKLLPSEKAAALLQQYEAIKHQGARGDDEAAGKLSLESVGQRNGMSVKTVQRYLWLNDLVPDLRQTMDNGKLAFTPAVEISRIRLKHQKYIAVSIEGQQSSPSKGQAQRLRELDKENKLSPDVIDGILSEEKKKEDRDVIISGSELEKFFGKEATPRQMKDQIMALLTDWKEKQPPELAKPEKKMDMEK